MGLRSLITYRGFFRMIHAFGVSFITAAFSLGIFGIQTLLPLLNLVLRVLFAHQECDLELRAGEPLLQEVILYGRELTQDDLLDDNEKEKITRDTAQLLEHYDHLRNFIDDEQERFVFSIIIYIRLFNNDIFLFLVE